MPCEPVERILPRLFTIVLAVIALCGSVAAQQKIVGKVIDLETKRPVKQALVKVKGTEIGALTNVMGFFEIKVDTASILTIEHPGYLASNVKIASLKNIRITLQRIPVASKKKTEP